MQYYKAYIYLYASFMLVVCFYVTFIFLLAIENLKIPFWLTIFQRNVDLWVQAATVCRDGGWRRDANDTVTHLVVWQWRSWECNTFSLLPSLRKSSKISSLFSGVAMV